MNKSFSRLTRAATHLAAFLALLSPIVAVPLAAQEQSLANAELRPPNLEPGEPIPWLYENSNIPVDKAWTFGVLDNGVRYAVRRNGVPPGQVSVRVRIDAGSLMEEDDEQGFAHLLEHLTFRGSKYVPDGEAIRIWQRLGATFGSDSNAETTPTQTVYKLDLPNAGDTGLEESIKILSGMIREPGLTSEAVTAEVPIVMAEQRERAGAQVRISDATRQIFFAGQRLAERAPIGTTETLQAATSRSVRAFHRRWYRPENTVIVISGDGEPAMFEQLLTKYFEDWDVKGKRTAHPDFGDPQIGAPKAKAIVEPGFPNLLNMAILRKWRQVNDTVVYNEQLLTDLLATQLINRRLEGRARAGGSYLQASVSQDDISRSVDGTFISIIPIGDDWEAALMDVRGVIADALASPPSQEEIDREIAEFDSILAVSLETSDTEAGAKQADDIVNAVDIRETVAAPGVALDVFRGMRDALTPEKLLSSTQALFEGDVVRGLLVTPAPVENAEEKLSSLMDQEILADESARIAAREVTFDDLPELGPPGSVESVTDLQLLGAEMVTFSNGARAILYANDAEVAKIDVKLRFGNGYQSFPDDEPSLLWAGESTLVSGGIGDLGQEELDRLTTGRRISLGFAVENDAFSFSAATRPDDLEDQLRLFAAMLSSPRWDEAPVRRTKAAAQLAYQSYSVAPQSIIERDLQYLTKGRDPRWKTPGPEEIAMLTPEAFRETWEPLLQQGPIEILIFGDFDRAQAIASLEKTIGALPPRMPAPITEGADSPAFPDPVDAPIQIYHKGSADQAAAFIGWPTGGGLEDVQTSRQMEILGQIFNNRLFEKLRAQEGASYAPQVINSWPTTLATGGYFGVLSQLDPKNVDRFYAIVDEIRSDLIANPVDQDELSRVTEPLYQMIARASTGNSFWLSQLQGGSYDVKRISAVRTILRDYTVTTPERMQQLAKRYLVAGEAWKLVVLPDVAVTNGQSVAR
jgi:zinc protease